MTDQARHDSIYSADYYARDVEGPAAGAAFTMASSITRAFRPGWVVDVGCGTGALLAALRDKGWRVVGLEYSTAGLAQCAARGIAAHSFDIETGKLVAWYQMFDVAVGLEVAEHLHEHVADSFVDLLTWLAPAVVFTAAPPGQGGVDHVNEQPPHYWIDKFIARGYLPDLDTASRFKREWVKSHCVAGWYSDNLMIFRK